MIEPIRIAHQKGPYQIEAEVLQVGEDIVLSIWGGTKPHIGALALAIPRASLKDPSLISSTVSVLARLGHKEDGIVKRVSEKVSARLNKVVAVSAGMHWDRLPDDDIRLVQVACDELVEKVIGELRERER
jgi:hypothetical protein